MLAWRAPQTWTGFATTETPELRRGQETVDFLDVGGGERIIAILKSNFRLKSPAPRDSFQLFYTNYI
jgi:hypothetical protein